MRCDVLTIFPELIHGVGSQSMMKRAQEKGLLTVLAHNLRDYTDDPHHSTDDTPYGGGGGMVMKAEPIFRALQALKKELGEIRIIMPSPQGLRFSHELAIELSQETRPLVFICGHYEGIDERVKMQCSVEEISLGDYVVTGGELPALLIIDAAMRLIPGVLGDTSSAQQDSFVDSLLDFPHFTRPAEIDGVPVPDVLLSGNHEAIRRWRRKEALRLTLLKRPDLLSHQHLNTEDHQLLKEIEQDYTSAPSSSRALEGGLHQ